MKKNLLFLLICTVIISCRNKSGTSATTEEYGDDVIKSVLIDADSLNTAPFVASRVEAIKAALQQPLPVLLCGDSLNENQKEAQRLALQDTVFMQFVREIGSNKPMRSEIFGVYPARQSDMGFVKTAFSLPDCYRVEMYNYAINLSSTAIVDVKQQKVLSSTYQEQAQPDIPKHLI
ncbi:MAG: hypothetical protein WBC06_12140, partial [Chitinophagaceae bacterium]